MGNGVGMLLVEQNAGLRQMIQHMLATSYQHEISVVGVFAKLTELYTQPLLGAPQIALVGVGFDLHAGLAELPMLRAMYGNIAIVVLGPWEHSGYRAAAIASGADDYIATATLNQMLPTLIDTFSRQA